VGRLYFLINKKRNVFDKQTNIKFCRIHFNNPIIINNYKKQKLIFTNLIIITLFNIIKIKILIEKLNKK